MDSDTFFIKKIRKDSDSDEPLESQTKISNLSSELEDVQIENKQIVSGNVSELEISTSFFSDVEVKPYFMTAHRIIKQN